MYRDLHLRYQAEHCGKKIPPAAPVGAQQAQEVKQTLLWKPSKQGC